MPMVHVNDRHGLVFYIFYLGGAVAGGLKSVLEEKFVFNLELVEVVENVFEASQVFDFKRDIPVRHF